MTKVEKVIHAHKQGIINLEAMPISHITVMLVNEGVMEACSTHTVQQARKSLGIFVGARPYRRAFYSTEEWNEQRQELLEGWR
jgi:hypothetical protein